VDWIDDADSRVDIIATALGDLRGVCRVGWGLARGRLKVPVLREPGPSGAPGGAARGLAWQLPRFFVIGVLSTAAYVLLYLLFRGFAGAQAANLAALLLTAVGNTAANRRLTFGVRGRAGAARHQFRGLIAFAAGLVLTSGALAMLHAASPSPGRGTEVTVLVAANLAATLVRFALYRNWVFGSPRGGGAPPETSPPEAALPEIALPEIALPEITPVDVINETSWSTR
jgi:putative flippase GtrA